MILRLWLTLVLVAPAFFVSRRAAAHAGHSAEPLPSAQAMAQAAALPTALARGIAFYKIGAMQRALSELEAASKKDPLQVRALRYIGMVQTHERRFPKAFEAFKKALAQKPKPPELYDVHYYFGDALYNAGIYDKAIARFRILTKLNPNHSDARAFIGEAFAKLGKKEEAAKAFRRAIAINPKSSWANHSLADVLVSMGKDDAAIRYYREDLRLVPHCQTARISLARALDRRGRLDEALREYYTSLAYHLGDPLAHNGMARIFFTKGQYARSLAEYARTLDYDANNVEAKAGLKKARDKLQRSVGAAGAGWEITFWRYVGSWLPAALVAIGFLIAGRRRERRS